MANRRSVACCLKSQSMEIVCDSLPYFACAAVSNGTGIKNKMKRNGVSHMHTEVHAVIN